MKLISISCTTHNRTDSEFDFRLHSQNETKSSGIHARLTLNFKPPITVSYQTDTLKWCGVNISSDYDVVEKIIYKERETDREKYKVKTDFKIWQVCYNQLHSWLFHITLLTQKKTVQTKKKTPKISTNHSLTATKLTRFILNICKFVCGEFFFSQIKFRKSQTMQREEKKMGSAPKFNSIAIGNWP